MVSMDSAVTSPPVAVHKSDGDAASDVEKYSIEADPASLDAGVSTQASKRRWTDVFTGRVPAEPTSPTTRWAKLQAAIYDVESQSIQPVAADQRLETAHPGDNFTLWLSMNGKWLPLPLEDRSPTACSRENAPSPPLARYHCLFCAWHAGAVAVWSVPAGMSSHSSRARSAVRTRGCFLRRRFLRWLITPPRGFARMPPSPLSFSTLSRVGFPPTLPSLALNLVCAPWSLPGIPLGFGSAPFPPFSTSSPLLAFALSTVSSEVGLEADSSRRTMELTKFVTRPNLVGHQSRSLRQCGHCHHCHHLSPHFVCWVPRTALGGTLHLSVQIVICLLWTVFFPDSSIL